MSIKVDLTDGKHLVRDYRDKENRPIVYRKTPFVESSYPHYETLKAHTNTEESLALLDEPNIGYLKHRDDLIDKRDVRIYYGHTILN